jgi:membrane-associated phospholipid phosphatase
MTDPKYLQYYFALINTHHSSFSDVLMYYTTWVGEGLTITIILLTLLGHASLRNWWYFTTALLCNVLPTIITQIIKNTVDAPRPLKYFGEPQWIHMQADWPKLFSHSFPSGHSTGAFSMFCFLSMLLPKRYRFVGFIFFLCALMVGYSRIYLAAHFLQDVYGGSIIGGLGALIIFAVMRRYQDVFFRKKDLKAA